MGFDATVQISAAPVILNRMRVTLEVVPSKKVVVKLNQVNAYTAIDFNIEATTH